MFEPLENIESVFRGFRVFGIQTLTVWVHHVEPQREQHKHDRVNDGNNVTFHHNSKALLATVTTTGGTASPPGPRLTLLRSTFSQLWLRSDDTCFFKLLPDSDEDY